jgi:hypothetical protein
LAIIYLCKDPNLLNPLRVEIPRMKIVKKTRQEKSYLPRFS